MTRLPDPILLITGTARSGTTLLRNMVAAHPLVAIPEESHFIGEVWRELRLRGRPEDMALAWELVRRHPHFTSWGADVSTCEAFLTEHPPQTYGDLARALFTALALSRGKPMSADKTTHHALLLPVLAEMFPTSRVIHVLRDPRAVAMSLALQPWIRDGIVGAAHTWREHVGRARAAASGLGGRFLEVRYELLVEDPRRELDRICQWAALEYHPAMLDVPQRTEVLTDSVRRAPHHATARGLVVPDPRRWREEMSADDVATVELIAGELMDEVGYPRVAGRPTFKALREIAAYRLAGRCRWLVRRRWGVEEPGGFWEPTA